MFKILILLRIYMISVDNTAEAILDRPSFMRFMVLGINGRVLDASWTKHNGKRQYRCKNHVKENMETRLLMAYEVMPTYLTIM